MTDSGAICVARIRTRDDFLREIDNIRAAFLSASKEDEQAFFKSQLEGQWQQMWMQLVLTDEDWKTWIGDASDKGEVVAKWYLDTRGYEAATKVIEEAAYSQLCLELVEPVVLVDFRSHYVYGLDIWKKASLLLKRAAKPAPTLWNSGVLEEMREFGNIEASAGDTSLYKHDSALERWQVECFAKKDDPQTVIRAINFYASLPQRSVIQIFTDLVYGKTGSEWEYVWLRFVSLLNKELKKLNRECDASLRLLFMKHFPYQPKAYEFALKELPMNHRTLQTVASFLVSKEIVTEPVLKNQVLRILPQMPDVDTLRKLFSSALMTDDPLHTIERAVLELLQKRELLSEAHELMNEMLADKKASLQVEVWLMALHLAHRAGRTVTEIFVKAFAQITEMDWPERLLDEWRRYVYIHGFDADIQEFQRYEKRFAAEQKDAYKRATEDQTTEEPPSKKRKHDETGETFVVIVSNIPETTSEKTIARFFKGYGSPKRTRVFKEAKQAVVEFEDSETSAVLSRNGKKIDENEVTIKTLETTSLWFSMMYNYNNTGRTSDFEKARASAEKFGRVIDIEYPFLSENSFGFMRVEYSSDKSAIRAAFELGSEYDLSLSNPLVSDPQLEAFAQRRVVVWTNPPSDTELRDVYNLFGLHTHRVYCKNIKGPGDDKYVYVTFGDVEEAEQCLKLNGETPREGQPAIKVRVAENAPYEISVQPAPSDTFLPRRLDILNVPKSFTEESLSRVFTAFGAIERLRFYPDNKKAVVTFKRAVDAAACEALLNGVRAGKDKLKVFLNTVPKPRSVPKPVPKPVLKPKGPTLFIPRGALLNAKPKPKPAVKTAEIAEIAETSEKKSKSNEDFRKLLFQQ